MDKVSFKYKRYEEIGVINSLKDLSPSLEAFSKDSLKMTPILIYIDNPEKIIVYSKVGN